MVVDEDEDSIEEIGITPEINDGYGSGILSILIPQAGNNGKCI